MFAPRRQIKNSWAAGEPGAQDKVGDTAGQEHLVILN